MTDISRNAARLAKLLNISESYANDLIILRMRNNPDKQLEQQLLALHEAGTPPDMNVFGVIPDPTPEPPLE